MINDILNNKTVNNEKIINKNEKTINNNLTMRKTITMKKQSIFFETPMCIKSKRAVLNPKSNDNKSF